jgi:hypothetical protein
MTATNATGNLAGSPSARKQAGGVGEKDEAVHRSDAHDQMSVAQQPLRGLADIATIARMLPDRAIVVSAQRPYTA